MSELSVFVDESGHESGSTNYYLVTLVLHDQNTGLDEAVGDYEDYLATARLPDIPFHANPLLHGQGDYTVVPPDVRKKLLGAFRKFVNKAPVKYVTFSYRWGEIGTIERLVACLRRDMVNFLAVHLTLFQSYDSVKIYYDDGQDAVATSLREAFSFMLFQNALLFKNSEYRNYRLAQVADYLCTIEFSSLKFDDGRQTATDAKFFGTRRDFRKNYLKQARKLHLTQR